MARGRDLRGDGPRFARNTNAFQSIFGRQRFPIETMHGLLEVRPGDDGRTRLVRVTPQGEQALAEAFPLWQTAQEAVVSELGHTRYEALFGDTARTVSLAAGRTETS